MTQVRSSRLLRWLLLALLFAAVVLVVLTKLFHWDDRARLWWQEENTSEQARADSVWLPGYRAVIQGKALKGGLEGQVDGARGAGHVGIVPRGAREPVHSLPVGKVLWVLRLRGWGGAARRRFGMGNHGVS